MRIRTLVLIVLAIIAVFGSWFLYRWVIDSIRPSYLQVVEENLVETSRLLAAAVSSDPRPIETLLKHWKEAADLFRHTAFEATIYDITKTHSDLEFYIVDSKGIVRFHSHDPDRLGEDYSKWNDVHLTLMGDYGVRSTRTDPGDAATSRLHVAAPILREGELAGVLTVIKPITWPFAFMEQARQHVWIGTAIVVGVSILMAIGLSSWITRPIERLTRHADALADGKRAPEPRPGLTLELRKLHASLHRMRSALDGKDYIENYITNLTHEIRGPLSGIRSAAELLDEDMDPATRHRFLANIRRETGRIDRIVDQLLRLAEIEATDAIPNPVPVDLAALAEATADEHRTEASARAIEIEFRNESAEPLVLPGNPDLLRLALSALIRNAIEFSPHGGRVWVTCKSTRDQRMIGIRDEGPGIPEYARDKVFDRFFSLPRPDHSPKSSGLGLSLALEIAKLHEATLRILPGPKGNGTEVTFSTNRPPVDGPLPTAPGNRFGRSS